jgi:ribonuclease HI
MAKKWYVVSKGRVPGVYEHWDDVHQQVNGFKGNCQKGYASKAEAEAHWRRINGKSSRFPAGYVVILLVLAVTACVLYLMLA